MKADLDALAVLHKLVADEFTNQITNGVKVVVKGPDGEPIVERASVGAATLAAARAFLRDNQVFADRAKNKSLANLSQAIPDDDEISESMAEYN